MDETVQVKETGKMLKIKDFLTDTSEEISAPSGLLIEIIKQTDCQDGVKAQGYVDLFIGSKDD